MKKPGRRPKRALDSNQFRALLASTTKGDLGHRNRAIIYAFWRAGLRTSEVCKLKPCDIDFTSGTLRVLASKRGRNRTIGLDPEAAGMIAIWTARRAARGLNGQHPLFCNLSGKPLTTNAVRELLNRLAIKAGLGRNVKPLDMRATFASVAARQVPLVDLQWALGHESLESTSRYVQELGGESIDSIRNLKWG